MRNLLLLLAILFVHTFLFANGSIKATIGTDKVTGPLPLNINFNSLQEGSNISCRWDFGNGNTSVLKTPSATFVNPGTYSVKLVIENGVQTDSCFISIKVLPNPNMLEDFLKSRAINEK